VDQILKSLRSVKDLALDFYIHGDLWAEPHWPETWSQHTNLSRLAFQCRNDFFQWRSFLPEFLTDLRNLRDLEWATGSLYFDNSGGEAYLNLIAKSLTRLTRLQIAYDLEFHCYS
jgi:hypothetical protein